MATHTAMALLRDQLAWPAAASAAAMATPTAAATASVGRRSAVVMDAPAASRSSPFGMVTLQAALVLPLPPPVLLVRVRKGGATAEPTATLPKRKK